MGKQAKCHPTRKHYGLGLCEQCYSQQAWLKRAAKRREAYYQQRYRLSAETVDALRKKHKGCWVCGQPGGRYGQLHVDHDHKTGRVRGLLCFKCNTFVGLLESRLDLLPRIFRYLNLRIPHDRFV